MILSDIKSYINSLNTLKEKMSRESIKLVTIWGNSEFLIQLSCGELKKSFAQKQIKTITLDANKETFDSFEQLFKQGCLFEEKINYLVNNIEQNKNFYKILSSIKDKSFFTSPLILVFKKSQLTTNIKKEIKRLLSFEIYCPTPKDSEINQIINYICNTKNIELTKEALNYLQDKLGSNLTKISNELNKISLILGGTEKKLSTKDICNHTNFLKEEQAFLLTSFLLEKKTQKAQAHITDVIKTGDHALSLVGIIAYFCRTALYIKTIKEKYPRNFLNNNKIKLPNFLITRYNRHINLHTKNSLKNTLTKCSRADILLKTKEKKQQLVIISDIIVTIEK